MMDWNAVGLMFSLTAMNHMGFIDAVEERIGRHLPVVGCIKCSVFWTTLIYGLVVGGRVIPSLALAFLYSYLSLWLELAMGTVDRLYLKLYERIVSTAPADKAAKDKHGHPQDSVSYVR